MSEYILNRIEAIRIELEELKRFLMLNEDCNNKLTELNGIWKGIEISDEDIENAKKSLFKNTLNI